MLKDELKHITEAYDNNYSKLSTQYNNLLFKYEEQYKKLKDAHLKHRNRMISDAELKQAEEALKPYKNQVEEAGYELDTVQRYKEEDVLYIINEIEAVKEEYLEELTEEIAEASNELQDLKQTYLGKIIYIGSKYKSVIDTENLMKKHLKNTNGFTYNSNMKKTLELKTDNLPVSLSDLTIEKEAVKKAL